MDWGHIGSGFLLILIFFITLPFLGESEFNGGEQRERRNLPNRNASKIIVVEKEILGSSLETQKDFVDPKAKMIQMEMPKKPSWFELKPVVRRETVPDPRFAAPEAPLICTINRTFKQVFRATEEKAIGCCPEDDAEGTPYGPGKACCCGKIYVDNGEKFCCEESCSVMDNVRENKKKCKSEARELPDEKTTTTSTTTHSSTTTTMSTTTSSTSSFYSTTTTLELTTEEPDDRSEFEGSCSRLYKKTPQKIEYECDAERKDGSTCNFSCPDPLRLNGTDVSTCSSGKWSKEPPSCCMRFGCSADFKLDLFLIVDASSSIGTENFALVRRFIKSLADYFEIGQDRVRIGLISFNRKVSNILKLSDVEDKEMLDAAVDSIPYNGKGTNTGRALQEVVDNAFVRKNGDRPDVENQVVVITDGKSKDDIKTPGRALKKIAHVMAIGVGVKVRAKDLFELASDDEYVYTPESYSELGKLKFEVADKHCPPGCV